MEKVNTDDGDNGISGHRASMTDAERGYASLNTTEPADDTEHATLGSDAHHHGGHVPNFEEIGREFISREKAFWNRLRGQGRRKVGWLESGRNILTSSYLNVLLVFIPFAWLAKFLADWHANHSMTFALCFVAIIPLENLFDWGGEQMALYLGKSLGDLLIITLNNAVEATLAIILLLHCELRLLQATIVGVVILHLLLIPGTAFLAGGVHILEQDLHPHHTQLNHSLLTIGVLTLLLPTSFFAALDRGSTGVSSSGQPEFPGTLISDDSRHSFLHMSRALAIILLIVYVASRIYLHNPPGEDNALKLAPHAPEELKHEEEHLKTAEPEVNPWACMILLVVTVGIMATTAEWLVESIEFVRDQGNIREEWFGLILLPVVSFAGDGLIAIVFFIQSIFKHYLGREIIVPSTLAKARAIDLSIQFTLFWMPFLVLLGWWTSRPMHLLFDYFELALLLGSCFLVNYVTADSKTNWVEGLILVSFYAMIAVCAWFYVGQAELGFMLACETSVAEALLGGGAEGAAASIA